MIRNYCVSKVEAEMRWVFKSGEAGESEPYPSPQIISRTVVLLDAHGNELRIPVSSTHLVGERFRVTIEPEEEPDAEHTVGKITLRDAFNVGGEITASLDLELLGQGPAKTITLARGDSIDLRAPATLIRFSKT